MPAAIPTYTTEPMAEIFDRLSAELREQDEASLRVPDPDTGHLLGLYPGEVGPAGVHRPYLTWTDLADLLDAHLLTPLPEAPYVRLRFRRRPTATPDRSARRYAAGSEFGRLDKLEDPHFLHDLREALTRAALRPGARVLSLGVNSGRELAVLEQVYPGQALEVLGLDLEPSALEQAQARFPDYRFQQRDVTAPGLADLGPFDVVLALSLLQSPGIVQEDLLRTLRGPLLAPAGTLILGFPNVRYRGGDPSYGARMLNFTRPDLSLLMRDVTQARRHLQRHGFTVYVTGKYEVLVTGVRRPSPDPAPPPVSAR